MSLIDRYLHAVGEQLPASTRDDIVAELAEDVHAQAHERSAALGRPLTEQEEAALLKPYGHPMFLAARFRRVQHVVGPRLFPFYWSTLKVALAVALAVQVAFLIAFAAAGRPLGPVVGGLLKFPVDAGVTVFGWVTLVFAVADVVMGRVPGSWDPRTLPAATSRPARTSAAGTRAIVEMAFSALFLAWWSVLPRWPVLAFGPAASHLVWTPALQMFYWPVLALIAASMFAQVARATRPDWRRTLTAVRVLTIAAALFLLVLAVRAGDFVVSVSPESGTMAAALNMALRIAAVVVLVTTVVSSALEVFRRIAARVERGGL
jgi:hypothetical protein